MIEIKYIAALVMFLNVGGCSLIDSWHDDDPAVTRRYNLTQQVDHLHANSTFEITLIQNDSAYIDIICSENFQSKVDIKIENNILTLKNSISTRWIDGYEKVKLEINLPYLPVINIHKPCRIETKDTFKTDLFYLVDWGNFAECNASIDVNRFCIHSSGDSFGSYIVKGNSKSSEIYCRGSANYNLQDFYTDSCFLSHESILDITINAINYADIIIGSKGNVYYSGNPIVNFVRNGDGNLIKN